MVNYEALALGLKRAGIKFCFSTAAVGSLRSDWPVGTLATISDFVDLSGRRNTLFSDRVVHTDFSEPLSHRCSQALLHAGEKHGVRIEEGGVYVCENGPRYETPHEVHLLTHLGDVVGMTAASEAILCREAGVEYGCLTLVTNPGAGLGGMPLDHEDVTARMKKSAEAVVSILLTAAELVRKKP